jgi:hypothetical protein
MGGIGRVCPGIVASSGYPDVKAGPSRYPRSPLAEIDMSGASPGYWRRLVRHLTSDTSELDAEDLSRRVEQSGARRACDCSSGQAVTVLGRLRTVEHCPRPAAATLEAELFDGSEAITLVWLGRRRIPGIEPGRTVKASGRIAVRDGRKVLYNPYYELQRSS